MALGKEKKGFSEEETAILIDYYIQFQLGKFSSRVEAVKKISQALRTRAKNMGMEIDDSFRSTSGISFQFSEIENLFQKKPSAHGKAALIFIDMVDCYQNNRVYFDEVLQRAKSQISLQQPSLEEKEPKQSPNSKPKKERKGFDEEETAILIDYYIQFQLGKFSSRAEAVKKISQALRTRAKNMGMEIDDSFRSTSGISFQLSEIENLFQKKPSANSNGKASLIFIDMVNYYQNSREYFNEVLQRAKSRISLQQEQQPHSIQDQYFQWLSQKVPSQQMNEFILCYLEIEKFCKEKKILDTPLFETASLALISDVRATVHTNKFFQFKYSSRYQNMKTAIQYFDLFLKENPSIFSQNETKQKKTQNVIVENQQDVFTVNFDDIKESYLYTKPVDMIYFESKYIVENWKQLYVQCLCCLNNEPNIDFSRFVGFPLMGANYNVDLADVKGKLKMSKPQQITENLFVETNHTAQSIMIRIKKILELCHVDKKNVLIHYIKLNKKKNDTADSTILSEADKKLNDFIKSHDIKSCDFRDKNGCLWLEGDEELKNFVELCKQKFGVKFYYKENGAKALGGKKGWWTKSHAEEIIQNKQIQEAKEIEKTQEIKQAQKIQEVKETQENKKQNDKIENTLSGKIKAKNSNYIEEKQKFLKWLVYHKKIPYDLSSVYAEHIVRCEQLCQELNLSSQKFYGVDFQTAKIAANALMKEVQFEEKNKQFSHQLMIALSEYIAFLEYHSKKTATVERELAEAIKSTKTEESIAVVEEAETPIAVEEEAETPIAVVEEAEAPIAVVEEIETPIAVVEEIETPIAVEEEAETPIAVVEEAETPIAVVEEAETPIIEEIQENSEKQYEKIKSIFTEFFSASGFRINSSNDIRNFLRCYNEKFHTNMDIFDEEIRNEMRSKILNVGVLYKDFVLPVDRISEELKQQLLQYIQNYFEKGQTALYYKTLFEQFSEQMSKINDENMLKAYLNHIFSGQYYFKQDYMTKQSDDEFDVSADIKNFMFNCGEPVTITKICEALPHIPESEIKDNIKKREFIRNKKTGEYFHVAMFDFSQEELNKIDSVIEESILQYNFISGRELLSILDEKYPSIMERFSQYSAIGKRDAIAYYLDEKFSFCGNLISSKQHPISAREAISDFARTHHSFTMKELTLLKNDLECNIYFDEIYKHSIRINETDFIPKQEAEFDVEQIDTALQQLCKEDYIPLKDVDLRFLPDTKFSWNIYLLEQYAANFSKQYWLINNGFAVNCVGTLVKRASNIDTFLKLLTDVLVKSNIELNEKTALNYLYNKGYIASPKFSKIAELIAEAKYEKRQQKEG